MVLYSSVKPLLKHEDYERTLALVKSFGTDNGVGQKLQRLLEERASKHENWVPKYFFKHFSCFNVIFLVQLGICFIGSSCRIGG